MPKIIVRTDSSIGEYFGGCECALIEVTGELVEHARRRLAAANVLFDQYRDLSEVRFRDASAEFCSNDLIAACEANADEDWNVECENDGMALLPPNVEVDPNWRQATQNNEIVFEFDSKLSLPTWFFWSCNPKFEDTKIRTYSISLQELEHWSQGGLGGQD